MNITVGGIELPCKTLTFSGGEVQVRLDTPGRNIYNRALDLGGHFVKITKNVNSSAALMEVLLATDAVRRMFLGCYVDLVMPYVPYGRQDRVCYPGEALSLRVFTDIINAQIYESVTIWDCHSDVSLALLDRVIHRTVDHFVPRLNNVVVVAPDRGAVKRAELAAQAIRAPVVYADKHRDPQTGAITCVTVPNDCVGAGKEDFFIVDDICDGGRTFVELAKTLRPLTSGKIFLYVTHGIFSADFYELAKVIDKIYVANLFEPWVRRKPALVEVVGS